MRSNSTILIFGALLAVITAGCTLPGDGGGAQGTVELVLSPVEGDIGDFDSLNMTISQIQLYREGETNPTTFSIQDGRISLTADQERLLAQQQIRNGTYDRVRLRVSNIRAQVDGQDATVNVPDNALTFERAFTVEANQTVRVQLNASVEQMDGNQYRLRAQVQDQNQTPGGEEEPPMGDGPGPGDGQTQIRTTAQNRVEVSHNFQRPGWIAVHVPADVGRGEVIGTSQLLEGQVTETVTVNSSAIPADGLVMVRLYHDNGDETFSLPSDARPISYENGTNIQRQLRLQAMDDDTDNLTDNGTDDDETDDATENDTNDSLNLDDIMANRSQDEGRTASITVDDQTMTDGGVTIGSAYLEEMGYIVIRNEDDGDMGAVIGNSQLYSSSVSDVTVSVDEDAATETLFAVIYEDDGDGTFSEDDDTPFSVNGTVVSESFTADQEENSSENASS